MSLEDRISKLEAIEAIRERVLDFFEHCDNGGKSGETYNANVLAAMWVPDGWFQSGDLRREGSGELLALFSDLAQTFSLHYAGNYLIDIGPQNDWACGRWTAWESPILTGQAVWGCFAHRHAYVKRDEKWLWEEWDQTIHFFVPTVQCWTDDPRIVEQLISKGA